MATQTETWQAIAQKKQEANRGKIPKDWILPTGISSKYSSKSTEGVLDVPATCGILMKEEVAITEAVDATELLEAQLAGKLTYIHPFQDMKYRTDRGTAQYKSSQHSASAQQ